MTGSVVVLIPAYKPDAKMLPLCRALRGKGQPSDRRPLPQPDGARAGRAEFSALRRKPDALLPGKRYPLL